VTGFRSELIDRLTAAGDPRRAVDQQRYMKSALPFHGVPVPQARRIAAAVARDHPCADRRAWQTTVLDVWRRATHREQRYGAEELAYLRPYRPWLDADALPMLEEMIVTGAWWDHVDRLAGHHVGHALDHDRDRVRPVVWAWATDTDLWKRRTAILCQLRAGPRTDLDLLAHAIGASTPSDEFFLRKAIGWALRQYARTDPDWVRRYVTDHDDELSPLSRREAMKHLDR
jgi:3-methyladenine DNA glycosylase AlkD